MNLNHVRYFQAVCRNDNSITKASEELLVAQPSISGAIGELEKEMGLLLFKRAGRRLLLTDEGREFLEKADALMEQVDCFYKAVADISESKQKHLRVCIPQTIIACLFPRLWLEFSKAYPGIHLEIFEMPALKALDSIWKNATDVGIVLMEEALDPRFEFREIFKTDIRLCVHKDHPLATRDQVGIGDVTELPIILFQEGSYHRRAVERLYEEQGLRPNVLLHSGQLYTIQSFIENQIAVAFVMKDLFADNPRIACVPLDNPIEITIGVVWKKNKYVPRSVRRLIQAAEGFTGL